jgi:drug/metabolite transporter (DMT)-like permease
MQKSTTTTLPAAPPRDRLRAIGLMILAVSLFACLDATAKYLVTRANLPLPQVVWMRFLGQLAMMVLALGLLAVPRLFRTKRLGAQLLRSCLLLASTVLNFLALRTLRLDQSLTIQFLAPLVVALAAGPLLGEWVGWRRFLAICIGFCGILIVIRPGFEAVPPGVIFALGCMIAYASFILLTRYISAYDSAEVTLTYSMLAGVLLVAPVALDQWVWPADILTWALCISMGFWASIGHFIFIVAYRLAPASMLAPFLYTQLLTTTILGFSIFGDVPDHWTIAGSAIIIASGIYLVHRERVKKVPPLVPAPLP